MKVLLTGATGMIGESALLECLDDAAVTAVCSLGRNPLDREHPKLRQLLHQDFTDFGPVRQEIIDFAPDACFHCMGVSSVGMKEADFHRLTFDVTKALADVVYAANPTAVFHYVSGAGTDETESGSTMWARVKGKTENYVLNRGFRDAYAYRIGMVVPKKGVKSSTGWVNFLYTVLGPVLSLAERLDSVITSEQLGRSMIRLVEQPVGEKRLENRDIKRVSG